MDDAAIGHADTPEIGRFLANCPIISASRNRDDQVGDVCAEQRPSAAAEADSHDPDVLRAALIRESSERRRAECRAKMQTEVVKLALDLLVREPDIEGFFGALTKTMVEESESHALRRCG